MRLHIQYTSVCALKYAHILACRERFSMMYVVWSTVCVIINSDIFLTPHWLDTCLSLFLSFAHYILITVYTHYSKRSSRSLVAKHEPHSHVLHQRTLFQRIHYYYYYCVSQLYNTDFPISREITVAPQEDILHSAHVTVGDMRGVSSAIYIVTTGTVAAGTVVAGTVVQQAQWQ